MPGPGKIPLSSLAARVSVRKAATSKKQTGFAARLVEPAPWQTALCAAQEGQV